MATNPIVEIFRAIVRPAITIMFGAAIVHLVTQGITPPAWFLAMAGICISWYFGERAIRHIKEKKIE